MQESYRTIRKSDPDYPARLKNLTAMPDSFYLRGALPDPACKTVAIVGARACSSYGRQTAQQYARTLGACGVQVISGLAIGIDANAHKGCLDGGGKTFAVLGCGIDQCYPQSNYPLYRRILETGGGILSEYDPGTPPLPHHFPTRNRIISALSDAVVVIEARIKSGSLITADYAVEQGIQVYAVPGRVTDALSAGTNALIWQGAVPAVSPESILQDLGLIPQKKEKTASSPKNLILSEPERIMMEHISDDPRPVDTLCEMTGMSIAGAADVLLRLELKGCVYQPFPGSYAASYR